MMVGFTETVYLFADKSHSWSIDALTRAVVK